MMLFGLLFPILLIAALAYAFGWRPGQLATHGSSESRHTPLEVLKERYARGEISREEFEVIRQDLQ